MRITELYTYPVKSLKGIRLNESNLGVAGLPWDRHWMLVDAAGRFVTQRQLPKMATITTALTLDALVLSAQGHGELAIALASDLTERCPVRVWDSACIGFDEGAVASAWLTAVLGEFRGQPLRLVRCPAETRRNVKAKYLKEGEAAHAQFADAFPFLVASQQTLAALNQRLEAKGEHHVTMDRFRANIVVDAFDAPFYELFDTDLSGPGYQLAIRKPCERCPVTTVHQTIGEKVSKQEPLASLRELNPLQDRTGPYFGGNAILVAGEEAHIEVGQALTATRPRKD